MPPGRGASCRKMPGNPCARIKAVELHGAPEARDRVLRDDELRVVWAAAGATDYPFGALVR